MQGLCVWDELSSYVLCILTSRNNAICLLCYLWTLLSLWLCWQWWFGLTHLQTDNFSLIYGYDGSSFQRHYVNQGFEDRYPCLLFHLPFSFVLFFGAVFYVPLFFSFFLSSSFFSKAHKYRLQCYYTESGSLLIPCPFSLVYCFNLCLLWCFLTNNCFLFKFFNHYVFNQVSWMTQLMYHDIGSCASIFSQISGCKVGWEEKFKLCCRSV